MKKIILTICFLFITTLAFAQPKTVTITFTDENGKVIAEETLNEAETKSAQAIMISVSEWTINAIKNRARIAQDKIVEKSGQGSQYTPKAEKDQIINNLIAQDKIETAKERQAELEVME